VSSKGNAGQGEFSLARGMTSRGRGDSGHGLTREGDSGAQWGKRGKKSVFGK